MLSLPICVLNYLAATCLGPLDINNFRLVCKYLSHIRRHGELFTELTASSPCLVGYSNYIKVHILTGPRVKFNLPEVLQCVNASTYKRKKIAELLFSRGLWSIIEHNDLSARVGKWLAFIGGRENHAELIKMFKLFYQHYIDRGAATSGHSELISGKYCILREVVRYKKVQDVGCNHNQCCLSDLAKDLIKRLGKQGALEYAGTDSLLTIKISINYFFFNREYLTSGRLASSRDVVFTKFIRKGRLADFTDCSLPANEILTAACVNEQFLLARQIGGNIVCGNCGLRASQHFY